MRRTKRVFVLSLGRGHGIAVVAAVLAAALILALWPQPVHGGEGGYAETILYNAPINAQREVPVTGGEAARLAIIIDDFGQGREGVKEMMALDCPLTFAVMPFCEYTKQDAEAGFAGGSQIIAHLPMEPMHGAMSWLGKNPILCSLDDAKIASVTHMSLEDVPHAVGANVHMGSRASADERVMRCVLKEVASAGFFFVDSRTGVKSVIRQVADEFNVPCLERNVFLDGQRPKSYIIKQLRLAGQIALKNGYAVAIGHVGVEGGVPTAEAIREMIGEFERTGVRLVFVSDLLTKQRAQGAPLAVGSE